MDASRSRWRGGALIRHALAIAAVACFAIGIWPVALGGASSLVLVTGHSMEPTFRDGDLVWAWAGQPAVGDVVVYTPPELDGARGVHRVIADDGSGWVTQGDNNPVPDPWHVANDHVIGVVRARAPLGPVGAMFRDSFFAPLGLLAIAAAIAIWPSAQTPDGVPATPDKRPGARHRRRRRTASALTRRTAVAVVTAALVTAGIGSAARLPLTGDPRTVWAMTTPAPSVPVAGCTVMNQGQPVPDASCEITRVDTGAPYGQPGARLVEISVELAYQGAAWPDYFRLDFDLTNDSFAPAWNWTTSAVRAEAGAILTASCDRLPHITVDTSDVWGPVDTLHFQIFEDSTALAPGNDLCH